MSCQILICDDNDADVALLLHSFAEAGVSLETVRARDGEEAIKFLKGEPQLDLIVLDYHLPRRSGPEVLETLTTQGRLPRCPIVMLTSRLGREKERILALGVHSVLEKPLSLDGYLEVGEVLASLCQ